ncbi:YcxB family protein [Flavobacterium buctense]|uniref:YcxB family protein n=1 Tax=Flavobacterium buctense TaxID=1648146 RepID=A0ABU9E3N1_9FLAO|nr:YcxB family protein [Flavobacterium buctense]
MKLELHFNESIYRRQMELLYEMGYGRKKRYYKNSNYFGLVLVLIGALIVVGKNNIGYLFVMLGSINLFTYYQFHFKNKKITQKYEAEQLETIATFKENPIAIFEFNDDGLKYGNHTGNVTINWNDFLQYMIKDENIFLITKKFQPFVVGKSEVGEENYNEILNFIDSRIENKTSR